MAIAIKNNKIIKLIKPVIFAGSKIKRRVPWINKNKSAKSNLIFVRRIDCSTY